MNIWNINNNMIMNSVGHYPNTALFNPPKKIGKNPEQGSGLSSLGRLMCRTTSFVSLCVSPCFWQIFPRGCCAQCPVDRSWCAQRC